MLLLAASLGYGAVEYFVSVGGSDDNDGRTSATAFATVQRGVDALAPGDTLTIQPGEYFGPVNRTGLGKAEDGTVIEGQQTVIRAAIPGSVVLRGDVAAPEFRSVDGLQFVYAAEFDPAHDVQAVNELDTLTVLRRMLSPYELEFNPGNFYQDREAGLLYISPSDLQSPAAHRYTVSVVPTHGIYLRGAHGVVIEGISVIGFNSAVQHHHSERGHGGNYGIFLAESSNCVVRYCAAAFNGRGMGLNSRSTHGSNRFEHCTVWANFGIGGGGALVLFEPNDDEILYSTAFRNGRHGILQYIGEAFGRVYGSLSWGNANDFQLKAHHSVLAERSIGLGVWAQDSSSRRAENCVIGTIRVEGDGYRNNIVLSDYPDLDYAAEFADPANHDFRLQATSRFRGAAADGGDLGPFPYRATIYYVSPEGDDAADGLAAATAWRTLAHAMAQLSAGDTLYLEAGRYIAGPPLDFAGVGDQPVELRGRGFGDVVIEGRLSIHGASGLLVERLNFLEQVTVSAAVDVVFSNCRFMSTTVGVAASDVRGLLFNHCQFTDFTVAGVKVNNSEGVYIQGNLFANSAAPAVSIDALAGLTYSDYNGFTNAGPILAVGDRAYAQRQLPGRLEAHSVVAVAEFKTRNGVQLLTDAPAFYAVGSVGTPAGLWNPSEMLSDSDVRLAGPFLHSVTATTANIEWWTSERGDVAVAWGTAPGPQDFEWFESDRAGSYSLAGLEPDSEYFITFAFAEPVRVIGGEDVDQVSFSFRTAASDAEPVTWFVATDGDDSNSGRSLDSPFRTVNKAAAMVGPGDTVLIGGGVYHESVRIRATGDLARPITFRSMPGEKVVFDGFERNLTHAFYVTNKSWITIDGFYFTDIGRGGVTPWSGGGNAAIILYQSDNIQITRCLLDGRGTGPYSPGLLQASRCTDVLVQNCVMFSAMGGAIGFSGCPGMRIENNVFFRNFISSISEVINSADEPFIIRNNIFTDSLPRKQHGSLLNIGRVEAMEEDNNLYYLRIPVEDRRFMLLYDDEAFVRSAKHYRVGFDPDHQPVVSELISVSLPEYRERYNPDTTSFAGDPLFAVTLDMQRVDDEGQAIYLVDQLVGRFNRDPDVDFDFDALFATDPVVLERNIGLQPRAFADFHFNVGAE